MFSTSSGLRAGPIGGQRAHMAFSNATKAPAGKVQARAAAIAVPAAACGAGAQHAGATAFAAPNAAAAPNGRRAADSVRAAAAAAPGAGGGKLVVAITGATGFIGARLASRLAAEGHTVRVLTRDAEAARARLQVPRAEFFAPARWDEAVAGADAVVNLAGTPIGTRCVCTFLVCSVL